MRKVQKYHLALGDSMVDLPNQARILKVEIQDDTPCLWAEVHPELATVQRHFCIIGTGHEIPLDARWIATFQDPPFVWHVYEIDHV